MRNNTLPCIALIVAFGATPLWAALSTNVISGGEFEDYDTYVKTDNLGVTGKRPWQFIGQYTPEEQAIVGRENDLGLWIGSTPGLQGLGSYDGVSITDFDDPRLEYATNGTCLEEGMGYRNVTLDGSDHILDCVGFRKGVGQFLQAPVNHVPGQGKVDFDYFFKNWVPEGGEEAVMNMRVWVFGLPTLPLGPIDLAMWDGGGEVAAIGDAVQLYQSPWWALWDGAIQPLDPPAWQLMSDATDNTFTSDQPYPYYYLRIQMTTYTEGHTYWWFENARPIDEIALAIDDVVLQLQLAVPGDFNPDGIANLLDINDFVLAITHWDDGPGSYMDTYPYAHLETIDPSQGAEPGDPLINLLDIPHFVTIITGGGGYGGSPVPQPASFGLLTLGGLWLIRRRA